MTEKRYFKREWETEYYIFDSKIISEKDFDDKVEYEDYQAFADSLTGDEVLDLLNTLHEENKELKRLVKVTVEDYTDLKQSFDLIDKENEQLKQFIQDLTTKGTGRIDLANGYSYNVKAILTDFKR